MTAKIKDFTTAQQQKDLKKMTEKETEKAPRKQKEMDTIEPVFIAKILEIEGTAVKLAQRLGVADATLYEAKRTNEVRPAYEQAAELYYMKEYPDPNSAANNITAIICASRQTMAVVQNVVKANNGKFVKIDV